MSKYKSWNNIANTLYATEKIKNLLNSSIHTDNRSSIRESNFSTLLEIARVISEYSTGTHKKVLDTAIGTGDLYSTAYRNLKKHMLSSNKSTNIEHFTKTLDIIKPTLDSKHRVAVDKFLKVYDILMS